MRRRICALILGAASVLAAHEAAADVRKVCFEVVFSETRLECQSGESLEQRWGCGLVGTFTPIVGHVVELWEKDWASDDDYIGSWVVTKPGLTCVNFWWGGPEKDPDVYVRYVNEVRRTYEPSIAVAAGQSWPLYAPVPPISWRNGPILEPNRYVAMNCQVGATCMIAAGKKLLATLPFTTSGLRIGILDSARHMLQEFAGAFEHGVVINYPGIEWGGGAPAPAYTASGGRVEIAAGMGGDLYSQWVVPHELGHAMQLQNLALDPDQDYPAGLDYSLNGPSWSADEPEYDMAATMEGFADYVSEVTLYDPEAPVIWGSGDGYPSADTPCSTGGRTPRAVDWAFWDLDDFTREIVWHPKPGVPGAPIPPDGWVSVKGAGSGADDADYTSTWLAQIWSLFPAGTQNGDADEAGPNGVNMRDYWMHLVGAGAGIDVFDPALLMHCTYVQDPL